METISCIVTGRIGSAPRTGTTKNGKAWASFSLAADLPPRTAGGESETPLVHGLGLRPAR